MSTASRQGPWPSLSRFLHSPTVDTILQPSVQFGDANQPWRLHLKVKANRGFFSFTVLVGDPAAQITARTSPGSPAVRLVMRAPHQQETPLAQSHASSAQTQRLACKLSALFGPCYNPGSGITLPDYTIEITPGTQWCMARPRVLAVPISSPRSRTATFVC